MEGCLEMEGCHIILRFYRRFSMMQQTKKRLDVFFPFSNKIRDDWHCNMVLIVFIVVIAVDYSRK